VKKSVDKNAGVGVKYKRTYTLNNRAIKKKMYPSSKISTNKKPGSGFRVNVHPDTEER